MELPHNAQRMQINRFCNQYLQAEPSLDFPDHSLLREDVVQEELFSRLFDLTALDHAPPQSYQLRTLKELTARVESSIEDWDVHVRYCIVPQVLHL